MGISIQTAQLLKDELSHLKVESDSSLLQLGRQNIRFDLSDFSKGKNNFKVEKGIDASEIFYKLIGDFSTVDSVDIQDKDRPTYIHDLEIPFSNDFLNKYDFIYDGGTLEHVLNPILAMNNLLPILKVGGYIIHQVPANNFCNHGRYQFSPSFFEDYYLSKGFKIIKHYLLEVSDYEFISKMRVFLYDRLYFNDFMYNNLSDKRWLNFVIVQKTEVNSSNEKIPDIQEELRLGIIKRSNTNLVSRGIILFMRVLNLLTARKFSSEVNDFIKMLNKRNGHGLKLIKIY